MKKVNNIWAIGDIHGQLHILDSLLNEIRPNLTEDKIIFMGDMIDRGPQSREVVELIRDMQDKFPESVIVLMGNHEDLCVKANRTASFHTVELWDINGGVATRGSYPGNFVPMDIVEWMSSLPVSHEEPGFFFSHAPMATRKVKQKNWTRSTKYLWATHRQYDDLNLTEESFARKIPNARGICGHVHALLRNIWTIRRYPHYVYVDAGCGCHPDAYLAAYNCTTDEVCYSSWRGIKWGICE